MNNFRTAINKRLQKSPVTTLLLIYATGFIIGTTALILVLKLIA